MILELDYDETPAFGAVDPRVIGADAEIHLSHFSIEHLRAFLARSGFEVVHCGPDVCYSTAGPARVGDGLDRRAWGLASSLCGVHCYQTGLLVARKVAL